MTSPICYLNTDLDLTAACDLGPLAAAWERAGIPALHAPERRDDGCWYATFERMTVADDPNDTTELSMTIMLDAIESLGADLHALWSACRVREFNIGYLCGTEPRAFGHELTNRTLQRVARVGASVRITLYPPLPGAAA